MGIMRFLQRRDACLTHQESPTHVYTMHKIESLSLHLFSWEEVYSAGIVYKYINAPECAECCFNDVINTLFEANVACRATLFPVLPAQSLQQLYKLSLPALDVGLPFCRR
jgi:hypothetical protein